MVGNHLEEYIAPTSLVSPQVPAFVIIHNPGMLQHKETTATQVLKERFGSCVILADILIGFLQVWTGAFCSCICLLFYVFWRTPGSSGNLCHPLYRKVGAEHGWLPVQCSGWFLELKDPLKFLKGSTL